MASTADDLFRKLTVGVRFTKRDLDKDRIKKKEVKQESDEIDFFKNSTGAAPVRKKAKKCKLLKTPEEVAAFRREHEIRVYGSDVPAPIRSFHQLDMKSSVLETLKSEEIKQPTAVQMQGIPLLMAGRDSFVIAPTGSGKTLVFVLAILAKLLSEESNDNIRALVISPTRELALQIKGQFKRFTPKDIGINAVLLNKAVLNGWKKRAPKRYPSILVSTPKRLVQAIEAEAVKLNFVKQLVLDEADKLLELGLMEQIDDILMGTKESKLQTMLFSATIPTGIEQLARSFMIDDEPVRLVVGAPNGATSDIDQQLLFVGQEEGKLMAVRQLLLSGQLFPPTIIFCETIERANALHESLKEAQMSVDLMHAGRSQTERETIINSFRNGNLWFLITTELLARGLDFPEVAAVLNYDFPASTASYIHRIGRTGRAGKQGKAITLFTMDDAEKLKIVANVMRQSGCSVPDWLLSRCGIKH